MSDLQSSQTVEGLRRDIRKWDLVALFINVTVGAGIFRLPSEIHATVGAYSLPAFLVCAAVMGLIVLCFAEVSSRFTGTGGPYLYACDAFGPTAGFMVGWLMWLTRVTGFASLCAVFVDSLGYFWAQAASGPGRVVVITVIVVSLTAVNIIGVRQSAVVSNVLTVSKLIPLVLFALVGLFFIEASRFSSAAPPKYSSFSSAVFVLIYAFSGFEAVLINSGEVRNPQRNIPFALLTAIIAVTILFVMIQVVCIGTLPGLAASHRPIADAASHFLGSAGGSFISLGALISVGGTMNVVLLACSRLPFAMAEQGQLPRWLAATHRRFNTPHLSILTSASLVLVLALSGTFIYLASLSVITRVLVYASTCGALLVFRRSPAVDPAARTGAGSTRMIGIAFGPARFKAPAGAIISILSLASCIWLLSASGWREARDVAISSMIGLVFYVAYYTINRRFSEPQSE